VLADTAASPSLVGVHTLASEIQGSSRPDMWVASESYVSAIHKGSFGVPEITCPSVRAPPQRAPCFLRRQVSGGELPSKAGPDAVRVGETETGEKKKKKKKKRLLA
jgi:hypothetical protein